MLSQATPNKTDLRYSQYHISGLVIYKKYCRKSMETATLFVKIRVFR